MADHRDRTQDIDEDGILNTDIDPEQNPVDMGSDNEQDQQDQQDQQQPGQPAQPAQPGQPAQQKKDKRSEGENKQHESGQHENGQHEESENNFEDPSFFRQTENTNELGEDPDPVFRAYDQRAARQPYESVTQAAVQHDKDVESDDDCAPLPKTNHTIAMMDGNKTIVVTFPIRSTWKQVYDHFRTKFNLHNNKFSLVHVFKKIDIPETDAECYSCGVNLVFL